MILTAGQLEQYRQDGWIAPIDVLTEPEAASILEKFADAEREYPQELHSENRNNAHLVLPFLAELAGHPTIVSTVRQIVGDDVGLSSSVLFIKEPSSQAFVSWHQDATYMALGPDNFVTAWVALTPSTAENGCVAVVPGSHIGGRRPHNDTYGEDNILTRGQEVLGIDEATTQNMELRPGQMSLHHPWLIHGSRPNLSTGRRIGIAFQSYFGSDVRPTRGTHHALHIAGRQPDESFHAVLAPTDVCVAADIAVRNRVNADLADVLYDGAKIRRML